MLHKHEMESEEHQELINFFPKNMKKNSRKNVDSLEGGDILKLKFWKN
jgi:hypothetical protein